MMRPAPGVSRVADRLKSRALTTLKATALTPMPTASVSAAVAMNAGRRRSCRMAR